MELTLNEYQNKAMTTCMDTSANPLYMLFMLGEEVGELQGKFSKAIRKGWIVFEQNQLIVKRNKVDDKEYREWKELVKKEVGDCLWGLAGISRVMDWELNEVGLGNLDKLAKRKEAGTIVGNGDGIIRDK
jgi:NTP pyrophosphatase (non-canonical NTP hydrolase)